MIEISELTTEIAIEQFKKVESKSNELVLKNRKIESIASLNLRNLRRLDLSENRLSDLKGLKQCSFLTFLVLKGNDLTDDSIGPLKHLTRLKTLNLSHNKLGKISSKVIPKLCDLNALVLNDNEIKLVTNLGTLKRLNTLVLSNNAIKSLAKSGVDELTALTKLSASHNRLTEMPDLKKCASLKEIRLAHNRIERMPQWIGGSMNLKILDLGNNLLNDWADIERISKCLALKQLSLKGCPISGCSLNEKYNGNVADVPMWIEEVGKSGQYKENMGRLFPNLLVRDDIPTDIKRSKRKKPLNEQMPGKSTAQKKWKNNLKQSNNQKDAKSGMAGGFDKAESVKYSIDDVSSGDDFPPAEVDRKNEASVKESGVVSVKFLQSKRNKTKASSFGEIMELFRAKEALEIGGGNGWE